MLTAEQLAERRKGITATDVAKIAGQSPYGCGEDVRLDKMGAGRPFVDHPRVRWGNLLEGPITFDYCERHGVFIEDGERVGTLTHPTEPWAMATPDGIVYAEQRNHRTSGPLRGFEVKTHTSWLSSLYGEPGTDQVPPWELIQCVWNIWVASAFYGVQLERWDLTVFMDGLPTDYTILRDAELEAALIKMCRDFWQVHVVGGEPVPPDGSEAYSEIIKLKWPKHEPGKVIEATHEQVANINLLEATRKSRKLYEEEEERVTQAIKLSMGDAEAITWHDLVDDKPAPRKISWKRGKDGAKVGWKPAFIELQERVVEESMVHEGGVTEGETNDILEKHTAAKPGARPFNVPRSWGAK